MNKLSALFNLLKAGTEIADKAKTKGATISVNYIVLFISAAIGLLNTFDCGICNFSLTNDQLIGIATAVTTILALFNNVSTAATSQYASIDPVESMKLALAPKKLPNISSELAQEIEQDRQE
jgi:hypothetical protein